MYTEISSTRQEINQARVFETIAAVSRITGLSQYSIRAGCRNRTIPHIKAGCKYLINVPSFLEQLNQQSRQKN